MLQRFVLASCLTASAFAPLQAAASQAEIDTYATLLKRVIDREVGVVADRHLESFRALAGSGSPEAQILELHYARVFSMLKSGDEGKELAERAERLEKDLAPLAKKSEIRADLRALIIREPQEVVLSLTNPLWRDLNPGMPVPNADLIPSGFAERNEQRLRLLMTAVDEALPYYDKLVKDFEPELEKAYQAEEWKKEEWAIIQEATMRRMAVINTFYFSLKAFNEAMARGEQFGISGDLIADIDQWLGAHMKARSEQWEDWDYNFSDYTIDFKQRLLVVRLEAARGHGIQYASAKDMMPFIEDLLNLDEDQFRGVDAKRYARTIKMRFLDELMLWSLALANSGAKPEDVERVQKTAARFWKQFYRDLRGDLRSRNSSVANEAANHFIMAARMFLAQEKDSEAMKLMGDITAVKPPHPYAFNAKAWQDYLLTKGGSGGEVDWGAAIEAQDPESAIGLAHSFRRAATKKADPKEADALRMRAAMVLRNGIAGLHHPEYRDKFFEFGPRLYQLYGYVFKELGWMEHATLAAQAGVQAVHPYWGDTKAGFDGNPWGNPGEKGGSVDEAGEMVKRLLDDYYRYAGMLRKQVDTSANNNLYKEANELRRLMNPHADGGEQLTVITKIQDGEYEEAIELSKGFGRKADDLDKKIWFQYAVVQATYKWIEDESSQKPKNEELIGTILDTQTKEISVLKGMIKDELAKGDEGLEIARKSQSLIIACEISSVVRDKDWLGVMQKLDAEFWKNVTDRRTQGTMINMLCNAAMMHRNEISREFAAKPEPKPETILPFWNHYKHARDALAMVEERIGQDLTSNRKRIANVMNAVSKHSRWFVENIESGAKGFESISPEDYARLMRIAKTSTIDYVDLYVPTLPPDTPIKIWIALGNDLWSIGAKERALVFYEKYLASVAERPDLKAYRENPASVVDPVGKAIISARGSYKPQWEEIRDYLVDAPGLMDQIRRDRGESGLNEKKVDYPKAFTKIQELRDQLEKDRALLGGKADELFAQVDDLVETCKHLTWSLSFKSRMVQAYMELGQTQRAVELSGELIAYDPLYPPYITVFVEGVLLKGPEASETEMKEAQRYAAEVRNITKGKADMRMQYWTSACQVMELSLLLGEIDVANRLIARNLRDLDDPTVDLCVRGTKPRQARDEGDVAVWKRYLRIFDAEGIKHKKPFTIDEDAEGNVIAIHPEQ